VNTLPYFRSGRDESGFSMLERISRTTNNVQARKIFSEAHQRAQPLLGTLPCRPRRLVHVLGDGFGDPLDILRDHSLYPLHAAGMTSYQREKFTSNLLTCDAGKTGTSQLNMLLESVNRFGLQCPECKRKSYQDLGYRTSRTCHCISFVTRCPDHDCRLMHDHDCSAFETALISEGNLGRRSNAISFARAALRLLRGTPQESLSVNLVTRLTEKKYIQESGWFRTNELERICAKLFSDGFEDQRLSWLLKDGCLVRRFVRTVTRGRSAIHPVYLIVMDCLVSSIDDFSEKRVIRKPTKNPRAIDVDELMSRRSAWELVHAGSAGLTRTEEIRRDPADFFWLYRHDRVWLLNHQVPCSKALGGWVAAKIPLPLIEAIQRNDRDRRVSNRGRAPRPSVYQMRIGFGMSQWAFTRLSNAVGGIGPFAQLPASREIFILRRYQWALTRLPHRDAPWALSSIARYASLRIETLSTFVKCTPTLDDHDL
jgi:hypothetical protein